MNKISFIRSIKQIELDENGNFKAIKGYIERNTDEL